MKCVFNEKLMWDEGTSMERQYEDLILFHTGMNIEAIKEAWKQIVETMSGFIEEMTRIIRDNFDSCKQNVHYQENKQYYSMPLKIGKPNQVMNRKPMIRGSSVKYRNGVVGMKPTLQEQLTAAAKQLNIEPPKKAKKKKSKRKKSKKEILSSHDIKSLMGMNRETYSRGRGGAIRQK